MFHWRGFPVTGSSYELRFVHTAHTGSDNSDYAEAPGIAPSSVLLITLKNWTSCERIKKGGGGPVKLYKLGISKLGPLIKNPTLAAWP